MSSVTGITINCNHERRNGGGIFRPVQIESHHPIYQQGVVAPISALVGLPLLVYRHKGGKGTDERDMALENEIAARLMTGRDGRIVSDFGEQPGSITIVRKDGKPLTRQAIETIWMFHDYFLEHFSEDKRDADRLLNRRDFNHFCEDYKEDRLLHGHASFARLELPL
ncbi:hypothetical protein P691DRAFT_789079 [Macrolepiota fuliginosa MF-IS2]|uniref:Uncharacterized protein n=1 Tax=Macrolepiota fuliginosa MF-IS2 TaxID=1400762 RepID=A0A9P5XGX3_9AGAR|nr:hypothetical protein P691DRAFT_789079 [Macrolepiota fuliginosa MF-IS2]